MSDNESESPPGSDDDPPFDETDNGSDVILRSNDREDFHVRSALLAMASPFFARLLPNLCERHKGRPGVKPVVELAEDGDSLQQLLLWCDPRAVPSWELEDIELALKSAEKYEMIGTKRFIGELLGKIKAYVEADPLKVFAIAVRHQLPELVLIAAKETLHYPLNERVYVPQLGDISGAMLYKLQQYYFFCGRLATETVEKIEWVRQPYIWFDGPLLPCDCIWDESQDHIRRSKWWGDYIQEVKAALRLRPRGKTVFNRPAETAGKALELAHRCLYCRDRAYRDLQRFNAFLSTEVENRINAVVFQFEP